MLIIDTVLTFLGLCLYSGGTHTLELLLIFYSDTIHELPSVRHMTEKVSRRKTIDLIKDFFKFLPTLNEGP